MSRRYFLRATPPMKLDSLLYGDRGGGARGSGWIVISASRRGSRSDSADVTRAMGGNVGAWATGLEEAWRRSGEKASGE